MSNTSTPDRDIHVLGIGKQCSHPSCLLVDFLPFKCNHCEQSFCQEHFKVDDHKCAKYDEFKHSRIAPNCPVCNTPVAVRPGQDPNARMDQHLERECSVVLGKKSSSSTPRCKKATCNKVLFAPIRCDKCRQQFCPAHRFPGDHVCSTTSTPSNATTSIPRANLANFGNSAKEFNAKASAAGTAALGAMKKSVSASSAAASRATASASASASSSSKPSLPFNKVDRRAKAERISRLKGMRERAKKGLLSEDEKAILAAEEAEVKKDKDCVIM